MTICVFIYERDERRQRHLRQMERCGDWVTALALLSVLTSERPGAVFEIEAYPDVPGDADGE